MNEIFHRNLITKIRDYFKSARQKRLVVCGNNNKIFAANPKKADRMRFHIYGNHNEILVLTKKRFLADIYIGSASCSVDNCKIIIGEDSTAEDVTIRMMEDNLRLNIGNDCMFSNDIHIFCSDIHTIYNSNHQIINRGGVLNIGNHVWVGMGVYISKNSLIADNTVIGMKSVVAGKFEEPNTVIAGNPARLIKHEVYWDRQNIKNFEKNTK